MVTFDITSDAATKTSSSSRASNHQAVCVHVCVSERDNLMDLQVISREQKSESFWTFGREDSMELFPAESQPTPPQTLPFQYSRLQKFPNEELTISLQHYETTSVKLLFCILIFICDFSGVHAWFSAVFLQFWCLSW